MIRRVGVCGSLGNARSSLDMPQRRGNSGTMGIVLTVHTNIQLTCQPNTINGPNAAGNKTLIRTSSRLPGEVIMTKQVQCITCLPRATDYPRFVVQSHQSLRETRSPSPICFPPASPSINHTISGMHTHHVSSANDKNLLIPSRRSARL